MKTWVLILDNFRPHRHKKIITFFKYFNVIFIEPYVKIIPPDIAIYKSIWFRFIQVISFQLISKRIRFLWSNDYNLFLLQCLFIEFIVSLFFFLCSSLWVGYWNVGVINCFYIIECAYCLDKRILLNFCLIFAAKHLDKNLKYWNNYDG